MSTGSYRVKRVSLTSTKLTKGRFGRVPMLGISEERYLAFGKEKGKKINRVGRNLQSAPVILSRRGRKGRQERGKERKGKYYLLKGCYIIKSTKLQ